MPSASRKTRPSTCNAACCCLPEDQRAVLLLVALEDLSYAQVAKVLGDTDRYRDVAAVARPQPAALN